MFKSVTIIGFGLIGSSVARAIKRARPDIEITAADIDEDVCNITRKLEIADTVTSNLVDAVQGRDVILLAVPVGAYGAIGKQIGPYLKPGCLVTDAGSVKQAVIDDLAPHLPESVNFVPAHPISGTEFSGPESGFATLFDDRWCILTPLPDGRLQAIETATSFWEICGARIDIMSPERHDLVLGITSHLPHLIAYTIVDTAMQLEGDLQAEVIKFSAGGFRDFTRIAASDPKMWRDVFLNNRAAVLEVLQRFSEDLTALQKAIRRGDGDFLKDVFTRTRDMRHKIIVQGQADYRYGIPGEKTRENTGEKPVKAADPQAAVPPVLDPQKSGGSAA